MQNPLASLFRAFMSLCGHHCCDRPVETPAFVRRSYQAHVARAEALFTSWANGNIYYYLEHALRGWPEDKRDMWLSRAVTRVLGQFPSRSGCKFLGQEERVAIVLAFNTGLRGIALNMVREAKERGLPTRIEFDLFEDIYCCANRRMNAVRDTIISRVGLDGSQQFAASFWLFAIALSLPHFTELLPHFEVVLDNKEGRCFLRYKSAFADLAGHQDVSESVDEAKEAKDRA
ncbi:MAG: hypothetical protein WC797_00815 [Candidatus Paceibacterota bacterium]|jgi:hypothetical protein